MSVGFLLTTRGSSCLVWWPRWTLSASWHPPRTTAADHLCRRTRPRHRGHLHKGQPAGQTQACGAEFYSRCPCGNINTHSPCMVQHMPAASIYLVFVAYLLKVCWQWRGSGMQKSRLKFKVWFSASEICCFDKNQWINVSANMINMAYPLL